MNYTYSECSLISTVSSAFWDECEEQNTIYLDAVCVSLQAISHIN